jgi:FkbM family methyltransferase
VKLACAAGWKFLERKIRLKNFRAFGDFALAIADHRLRYFSGKRNRLSLGLGLSCTTSLSITQQSRSRGRRPSLVARLSHSLIAISDKTSMPHSNTLTVLGRVVSNPKQFANEWRATREYLTQAQQQLAHSQQQLADSESRLAEALVRIEALISPAAQPPDVREQRFWDLGEHHGIVHAMNGNLICIDTRDISLGHAIRDAGCWEPHVEVVCRRLINANSIAIDVGANIGYHTAVLARAAKSVLAIEANPITATLLRGTVALNGFRNVSVIENAVMDRPQAVEIFAPDEYLGAGAVARPYWYDDPNLTHWRRYPVEAVTLDSVSSDVLAVDLIRMDIEGCELAALRGAHELLSRSPAVHIVMEWGAYHMPDYGDIAEGLDYLVGLGFTHFAKIEPDGSLTRKNRAEMLDRLGKGRHDVSDVVISRSPAFGL